MAIAGVKVLTSVCVAGGIAAGAAGTIVVNNHIYPETTTSMAEPSNRRLESIDKAVNEINAREANRAAKEYADTVASRDKACHFWEGMPQVQAKLGCDNL